MIDHALVEAAEELRLRGEDYVLATVVAASGSAAPRLGRRMLVARERGWWRTAGGPCVVTYDPAIDSEDEDPLREGLGLGGTGIVDVLLERAGEHGPLAVLSRSLREGRTFALATVYDAPAGGIPLATHVAFDDHGDVVGDADPALACALRAPAMRAIMTHTTRNVTAIVYGDHLEVVIEAVIPTLPACDPRHLRTVHRPPATADRQSGAGRLV